MLESHFLQYQELKSLEISESESRLIQAFTFTLLMARSFIWHIVSVYSCQDPVTRTDLHGPVIM